MNDELLEMHRDVELMIESREGFNGNGRDLLRLDFESISEEIDDLEEKVEYLEAVIYDPDEKVGEVIYKELEDWSDVFETETMREDVATAIAEAVVKALKEMADAI